MVDADDARGTNGAEDADPPVAEADADRLTGLPVDDAVEVVGERHPDHDPEQVRATLETVAEDGLVTESGVQSALAHVSKVVSTPATRAEFAALDLEEARESVADVSEVGVVAARLAEFEARLDAIESEVEALDETLQAVVARAETDPVYQVARDVGRLRHEANQLQGMADELAMEIEVLERWVSSPARRYDDLAEDADDLEAAVEQLEADVDAFAADDEPTAADDEFTAAHAEGADDDAQGTAWFDLRCRRPVLSLLVTDLRAELADVRTVADRRDASVEARHGALVGDVDAVDERLAALEARLSDLATDEWEARFGDRLDAVARDLAAFDPPVDWHAVQETMAEHRRE